MVLAQNPATKEFRSEVEDVKILAATEVALEMQLSLKRAELKIVQKVFYDH